MCAFWGRVATGNVIATINGRRMHTLEDTTVGRERVRESGIVRRATNVASVMVNNATNGGAPLANANERPTIARNNDGNGIGNGGAGALARGGSALGRQQKVGLITQQKDSVETTSKDENDGEQ